MIDARNMPDYRFDPRTRPWYQRAHEKEGTVIVEPYVFFTTRAVGTTLARRTEDGAAVMGLDATLQFDPAHPSAMRVEASIDPTSLELNAPPKGFHAQLMGQGWFEAAKFPKITFRSTRVQQTGPHSARVTGDLTLHGVTKPVTLEATYNGGYPAMSMDPGGARIGFSAHGVLRRSAFGMGFGIPTPGTTFGVGDEVEFAIETEMSSKRTG